MSARGVHGRVVCMGDVSGGARRGAAKPDSWEQSCVRVVWAGATHLDRVDLPKDDAGDDDGVSLEIEELDVGKLRRLLLEGDFLQARPARVDAVDARGRQHRRELAPRQKQTALLLVDDAARTQPREASDDGERHAQRTRAAKVHLVHRRIVHQGALRWHHRLPDERGAHLSLLALHSGGC